MVTTIDQRTSGGGGGGGGGVGVINIIFSGCFGPLSQHTASHAAHSSVRHQPTD